MRLGVRKKNFKRLFLIILAALILFFIFYFMKSDFFIIKKVTILNDDLSCVQNSQIKGNLNFLGKNIFFLNLEEAEKVLKRKYFCIKSINFSKLYPDKLELKVSKREAKIVLIPLKLKEATESAIEQLINSPATQSAEILNKPYDKYVSDIEGIIFDKDGDINLTKVYLVSQDLSLGKKLDESLVNDLLKIIDRLKTFGIKSNDLVVDKKKLVLINSLPRIVFRIRADINNQLAALQLILNRSRIDDDKLEFIDLRFDKPVVRYGKGQSNLRN